MLIEGVTCEVLRSQAHPDFSPVGWHLGHIAYTESLWIAGHLARSSHSSQPDLSQPYDQLFSADGLPKAQRQHLPETTEILAYMDRVRSHTLKYLNDNAQTLADTLRLWHWLIQHEAQHAETIAMVLALHPLRPTPDRLSLIQPVSVESDGTSDMVLIEAGEFLQGCDAPEAIDNERPAHVVSTDRYWLDRTPVTCQQYRNFIEAGGYQERKWWSRAGWQWLQSAGISAGISGTISEPLYWVQNDGDRYPVCGVSWYEADAYARFVGKRLPTESEWEKAAILAGQGCVDLHSSLQAGCEQMLGNVWEWTDSWFVGYLGFRSFPYDGYSQTYFDRAHRVLRGGSWASPQSIVRPSFRNWYHPHRREMFAGFRCAV